jgi:hypothetical protein
LRRLLIALALVPGACDRPNGMTEKASVTVRLPPPRPAVAAPGFKAAAAQTVAPATRE